MENIPLCAVSMGCLCAGHARGNPYNAPCDTREVTPEMKKLEPLLEAARHNPRVQVSLWIGGEVKFRDERRGRHKVTVAYRDGGQLEPVIFQRDLRKPPRRAARRAHVARDVLARDGQAVLASEPPPLTKGKIFVRVYYTSQGGELLYWEEGPMHPATVSAKYPHYGNRNIEVSEHQRPRAGARKVVLPSQVLESKTEAA